MLYLALAGPSPTNSREIDRVKIKVRAEHSIESACYSATGITCDSRLNNSITGHFKVDSATYQNVRYFVNSSQIAPKAYKLLNGNLKECVRLSDGKSSSYLANWLPGEKERIMEEAQISKKVYFESQIRNLRAVDNVHKRRNFRTEILEETFIVPTRLAELFQQTISNPALELKSVSLQAARVPFRPQALTILQD